MSHHSRCFLLHIVTKWTNTGKWCIQKQDLHRHNITLYTYRFWRKPPQTLTGGLSLCSRTTAGDFQSPSSEVQNPSSPISPSC